MFSFFKKNKSKEQVNVPDWASFFTSEEYKAFNKAIEAYFDKLNIPYKIEDGVVYVGENDYGFSRLGLQNLSQMCKQNENMSIDEVVIDHFDTMIRINEFNTEFETIVTDFEKVEQYIGVRLYDTEYASYLEKENVLLKDFAEDMVAMLIFDLPESVMNIKPNQIEPWGKSVDELFEIGKKNIKDRYPIELTDAKVEENIIWFAEAPHFFAGNFAFYLEDYPQLIGRKGALVSFPNRHTVIIYPIQNLEVIGVLHNMLYLTKRMYEDGPGSITDKLYWYFDKQYIDIPHKTENGKLVISPPQEFVDALSEMEEK